MSGKCNPEEILKEANRKERINKKDGFQFKLA
jgi:hypothetical protein